MHQPVDTRTRSVKTFVDPIRSKFPKRRPRTTTLSFPSSFGGNFKSECFNCQGFGHQAQECPSPKLNQPIKPIDVLENQVHAPQCEKPNLDEVVYNPLDLIPEDELQDDSISIVRPLFITKREDMKEPNELQLIQG